MFLGRLAAIATLFSVAFSSDSSREEYLDLVRHYPRAVSPVGRAQSGEIEIILDPQKMAEIEELTGRDVGILARDKYWIWLNDACLFPGGCEGVYGRIFPTALLTQEDMGVAVVAVRPQDGKIALNCAFRHATRSWEVEIPRGGVDFGESSESVAAREMLEETGLVVDGVRQIGVFPPDNGMTSALCKVFLADVLEESLAQPECSEAIEKILFLSRDEIKEGLQKGKWVVEVRGEEKELLFRDPFLAYALALL